MIAHECSSLTCATGCDAPTCPACGQDNDPSGPGCACYGDDTLHCDLCPKVETAADLTPDWNPETGNHLSCERGAPTCARCGAPCPDGIQPSGIGPCCWPSWHPTSAELRDLRAAYHAPASLDTLHPPAALPYRWDAASRYTDPIGRPVAGAWADERAHGIGYRLWQSPMPLGWGTVAAIGEHNTRREASALRSRAFAADPATHPESALLAAAEGWPR